MAARKRTASAKRPAKKATVKGSTTALAKSTSTAATRRGEELVALVVRKKVVLAETCYDIGLALKEILDKKLYASLEARSFEELLAKRKLFGVTQAFKLISLARNFHVRTNALRAGLEKGYALARYSLASEKSDPPDTLVEEGIRIDGALRQIEEVTEEQITNAARTLRGKRANAKETDKHWVEAQKKAHEIEVALHHRGAKHAIAGVGRGHEGFVVHVSVPMNEVDAAFPRRR